MDFLVIIRYSIPTFLIIFFGSLRHLHITPHLGQEVDDRVIIIRHALRRPEVPEMRDLSPGPGGQVHQLDRGDGVLVPLLSLLQDDLELSEGPLVV